MDEANAMLPRMTPIVECRSRGSSLSASSSPRATISSPRTAAEPPTPVSTDEMTFKIRLYSGLSEEQVAWILRITIDDYCYWVSGKKLAPHEENHLRRVFEAIRQIDRGWGTDHTPMLLTERDGKVPVEMLRAGEYEQVVALLGRGPGRVEYPKQPDDKSRWPPPPHMLIGALHDRIHPHSGPVIATYPIVAAQRK